MRKTSIKKHYVTLFTLFLQITVSSLLAQDKSAGKIPAESTDELNRVGISLANDGKYEEALAKFERALAMDNTKSAKSYHNIGFAHELMGDKVKAMQAYRMASELNPRQIVTVQNLGKLQFLNGQYNDAIATGEMGLRLDPQNREIAKWLPEAYRKAAEQRMHELQNRKEPGQQQKGNEKCDCEKKPSEYFLELGYTFSPAILYQKTNSSFALHKQAGLTVLPMGGYALFTPNKDLSFKLYAENPYLGAVMPGFMAGREGIEFTWHGSYFFFGAGLMFTQINLDGKPTASGTNFITNTDYNYISDSKFGLFFGGKSETSLFLLKVYPRYAVKDVTSGPKSNAFDFTKILLEYRRNIKLFSGSNPTAAPGETVNSRVTDFIFQFSMDEFYITEYQPSASVGAYGHYFGVYDLSIGMEFGRLSPQFDKTPTTFGFLISQRLYFESLSKTNLESFGNGQGYFGFDSNSATQGNAFPSFRSNSFMASLFFGQLVNNRIIFREKAALELTNDSEPVQAVMFDFSVAVKF